MHWHAGGSSLAPPRAVPPVHRVHGSIDCISTVGTLTAVQRFSPDLPLAWSSYFLSGAISTERTEFFRSLLKFV